MQENLFTGTPVITVSDNRSVTVRTLNWNRTEEGPDACLQVTHSQIPDSMLTLAVRDPRLFQTWQKNSGAGANLTTFSSLVGQSLRRDSTDSGQDIIVFDAGGRSVWSWDPLENEMGWSYDELGRMLSAKKQLSGTEETITSATFVYGDDDPQTVAPQDNNLRGVCVRQYDEGGLLTTNSMALSGALLSSSQTFLINAEALPDWPEDEAGKSALLETTAYNTNIQADALARTLCRMDAAGHAIKITYDISGAPVTQSLQLSGQETVPLLTSLTFSAAGQVLTEAAGNGVTTVYSYEATTQRLAGISALRNNDSAMLQSLSYQYDPVGNLSQVSDATVPTAWFRNQATNGTRNFSYDALYQLISASGRENASQGAQSNVLPGSDDQYVTYTRTYHYDDSGNLGTLTHSGAVASTLGMVIDSTSNRSIRQDSKKSLTPADVNSWFTSAGQLRTLQTGTPDSNTTDSLQWDYNHQLHSVTLVNRNNDLRQSDREVYQYRGGTRVRKQTRTLTNASSNLWTVNDVRYLAGLELRNTWQETVTDGNASVPAFSEQLEVVTTQAGRSHIRVLHWVTGLPSGIDNDQPRYSVDDNIGSLQLELDGSGQLISREEYYPYGGTAVWSTERETEAGYKFIRYSGHERDSTGLYYYGYRYYAPWLCRWTASDPAGEVNGLNLFRFVFNNPTTLSDAYGLAGIKPKGFQWVQNPGAGYFNFAGMALFSENPNLDESARYLKDQGITTVISIELEDYESSKAALHRQGIRHIILPLEDWHAPSVKQLKEYNRLIDLHSMEGGVATHCWGGTGRTGIFLASRLLHLGVATSAQDAFFLVRMLYNEHSIELNAQYNALARYADSLGYGPSMPVEQLSALDDPLEPTKKVGDHWHSGQGEVGMDKDPGHFGDMNYKASKTVNNIDAGIVSAAGWQEIVPPYSKTYEPPSAVNHALPAAIPVAAPVAAPVMTPAAAPASARKHTNFWQSLKKAVTRPFISLFNRISHWLHPKTPASI